MNPALKDFKDADLRKELEDRRIVKIKAAQEENHQWLDKAKSTLTHEVIDVLVPKHNGADCTDENTWNGFVDKDHGVACVRCGLLEISRGEAIANLGDNVVELRISIIVREP